MKIQYTPVTSTNIRGIAHEGGFLHIEFHGGRRFSYGHVPAKLYEEMLAAKSVGGFFAKMVKGKFPVAARSQRCDNSPCPEDATFAGMVSTTKIHLCEACAKVPRFAEIALTKIELGLYGLAEILLPNKKKD